MVFLGLMNLGCGELATPEPGVFRNVDLFPRGLQMRAAISIALTGLAVSSCNLILGNTENEIGMLESAPQTDAATPADAFDSVPSQPKDATPPESGTDAAPKLPADGTTDGGNGGSGGDRPSMAASGTGGRGGAGASAGSCQGTAVTIDDGNECTHDECDTLTGVKHTVIEGRSCSDGNSCTTGDACTSAGACLGAYPLNCTDGLFCNGLETCSSAGGCARGQPPVVNDNIACTTDSCDEANDAVVHQAPADQAVCGQACIRASSTVPSPVSVNCSPGAPVGTVCNPKHDVVINVNCTTNVTASYTAGSGHLCPIRIHFYVDGSEVALSGYVNQEISVGAINLGTVGPGSHTISFGGEVGPGGCATVLVSWGGMASVSTSPSP